MGFRQWTANLGAEESRSVGATATSSGKGRERPKRGSSEQPDSRSVEGSAARTEPLSILRVATDLYPEVTGGGAIHAHAMSKRQAAQGHDVTVLTSDHGNRDRPTVETRDGYTVVRNRQLARPFGNSIVPGTVRSLRKRLADADVVHAHSHLYFSTNIAAAISRLSDVPLVVTNHGLLSQTAPGWVQRLFIPTVGRFTFNAADRILCYTDADRSRLESRGIQTPIEVITNGIDCQRFTPGRESATRQLLFVGRLTDAKGLPTLLDAVERLAADYPDLTLRVVGDGPGRERYERECRRRGIEDRVEFVGDVSYASMPQYYRESTVFVLPSDAEGLPRTMLEAMACETPVVTSSLPQLESVVDGAGFTVDGDSPVAIADAVGRLLEDETLRRRFGQNGRQRVLDQNVWSQTVDETTAVLAELVEDTAR